MPTPLIFNRVKEYTTTTGTDDLVLTADDKYQSFSDFLVNLDTVTYHVCNFDGDWESGVGIYNEVENSITRSTVISSSNADQVVDFPAGTKIVTSGVDAKIMQQLLDIIPYPYW